MRQESMSSRAGAEQTVRNIRRKTRKQYAAEEKIRIVLSVIMALIFQRYITRLNIVDPVTVRD
jgi:hypothetical protein